MKRTITRQLELWKDQENRKPLILQGVRQCGKTYTIKQFGRNNFENTAYFNFEQDSRLGAIFEYNYDTKRIMRELSLIYGAEINTDNTLVVFDEIQECPRAITSLKYFCEDRPDIYLICAGSLLGPAIEHRNISFPVGKVQFLEMYPMSLYEFLLASGFEEELTLIETFDILRPMPDFLAEIMKRECRIYYALGGMPEAVAKWIHTRDWEEVDNILNEIITGYSKDFGKYLSAKEALKVGWIWDSVPVQLAKENNKFVFSHVKEGKRASDLEDALQWLNKAGLVYLQPLVENPQLPLKFNADMTHFKVFMSDTGLLRIRCGLTANSVIEGSAMFSNFRGALTENFVMNELTKMNIKPYFWRSGNSAEVDFVFEHNETIIPLEAKSEGNTKAKSYALYCKRYSPRTGFKCSMNNVGDNYTYSTLTYSLPLYLIFRLPTYLDSLLDSTSISN